ncbi:phage tail assembly chaperone [Pseudomonas inefficax]|uniref:phage tail assembly chaperone n=1 Tax=Pseudomonas inefficax TaxID=2078786 RepID=UPI004046AFE3
MVNIDDAGKPYFATYAVRNAINWDTADQSGRQDLVLSVFREFRRKEQDRYSHECETVYREFYMDGAVCRTGVRNEAGELIEDDRPLGTVDPHHQRRPVWPPTALPESSLRRTHGEDQDCAEPYVHRRGEDHARGQRAGGGEFTFRYFDRTALAKIYDGWNQAFEAHAEKCKAEGASLEQFTSGQVQLQADQIKAVTAGWGFDDKFTDQAILDLVITCVGAPQAVLDAYQNAYSPARVGN